MNKIKINENTVIYQGNNTDILAKFPENYFDSVVCDPPYFLTDSSGKGFMGSDWDSISDLWQYLWIKNTFVNFVEKFLLGLKVEQNLEEANFVQESASIQAQKGVPQKEKQELAQSVEKSSKHTLPSIKDSAEVLVITKQELLDLLNIVHIKKENTEFLSGEKKDAKFVIPLSLLKKEVKNVVPESALKFLTKTICEENDVIFILMDEVKIRDHIEVMIGKKLESGFTQETNMNVKCAETIVGVKKFNVTTLSATEKLTIIKWITLLLCALNAIRLQKTIQKFIIENFFTTAFQEIFRVLKPGGHVLAFGGTRTYHLLVNSIEDAGFEIRDQIQWIYGQGFPKSYSISKGIDNKFKAERKVVGSKLGKPGYSLAENKDDRTTYGAYTNSESECAITAPATDLAKLWSGWGTSLKPANEPICLARKPISEKSIVDNVLKWGVGGLNIDACRIELNGEVVPINKLENWSGFGQEIRPDYEQEINNKGRFPANVIFDEEAGKLLDEQTGMLTSGTMKAGQQRNKSKGKGGYHGDFPDEATAQDTYGDTGGASRFFYCAKASRKERNAGLEGIESGGKQGVRPQSPDMTGKFPDHDHRERGGNYHPTVKPISLMEYLCKLITPPGGIVCDPYMGSGTTGVATQHLGFRFVGIELKEDYFEIAHHRLMGAK